MHFSWISPWPYAGFCFCYLGNKRMQNNGWQSSNSTLVGNIKLFAWLMAKASSIASREQVAQSWKWRCVWVPLAARAIASCLLKASWHEDKLLRWTLVPNSHPWVKNCSDYPFSLPSLFIKVFHFIQEQVFFQCRAPVWTAQVHNIAFSHQSPAVKPFAAKYLTSFTNENWPLMAKSDASTGPANKDDDTLEACWDCSLSAGSQRVA